MNVPVMIESGDDSDEAVAKRLEWLREIHSLNKRDMAASLGMSEQSWGQYENGARPLPLAAAKKIRKRYSASLEFIYFGNIEDLPHRIAKHL